MVASSVCLLIPAAEGKQEQAGEPGSDDASRPRWVSEPRVTREWKGF